MARMRYLKPEFWTDSRIVKLSPFARLLYMGMWNFAMCEKGHIEDDTSRLKMQILPADNVDVDELLAELLASGRAVRLTGADGHTWLQVPRLPNHQKVDNRWTPRCPACRVGDDLAETRESFSEALTRQNVRPIVKKSAATQNHSDTLPISPQEGRGGDRRGEEKNSSSSASPTTVSAPSDFDQWWALYPRKTGKIAAKAAYAKAMKSVTAARLLLATKRYAEDPNLPEATYIPHPSKWLNDGRWDDDPLPSRTATTARTEPVTAPSRNQY